MFDPIRLVDAAALWIQRATTSVDWATHVTNIVDGLVVASSPLLVKLALGLRDIAGRGRRRPGPIERDAVLDTKPTDSVAVGSFQQRYPAPTAMDSGSPGAWSVLRARQQAYNAVQDITDRDIPVRMHHDLEIAAHAFGLTLPQFDGSPTSNAAREGLGQCVGLPSGRVTPDGRDIPIEAVCIAGGMCVTGDLARRAREEAAAQGVLLDTWAAEEMSTTVYIQANPTRARQLVVLVGQKRALALAVKDWRRAARHTALDGLLAGSLSYAWPSHVGGGDEPDDRQDWDGLATGGDEQ
jgi:hypothetical protein